LVFSSRLTGFLFNLGHHPNLEAPSPDLEALSPKLDTPLRNLEAPSPELDAPSRNLEAPSPKLESPSLELEALSLKLAMPCANRATACMHLEDASPAELHAGAGDPKNRP